jgi:transcription-repair coupling factor (superfamily II helicase)
MLSRIFLTKQSRLSNEEAPVLIAVDRPGEGRRRRSKAAAFLSDFRDLRPGDFVVHIDHGVARFGGLQTLDLGPTTGEFMLLFYADDAKLYVPVERLDLVQRYSSAEGHQAAVGSSRWYWLAKN